MYPRVDMTQEQKCLNQKYNEVFDESLKEKTLNFCAVLLPNREEKTRPINVENRVLK